MKNKVIKLILATSLVAAISLPSVSSAIPRDGWQKSQTVGVIILVVLS